MHTSHLGIVKSKKCAKDVLFWLGMGKDMENLIANCETCLQYQASNTKDTMMSDEPPKRLWESVSTYLFSLNSEDYLLIVDRHSYFIETARLHSTSSKLVIEHTISVFARHGMPRIVKSDDGPQYTSDEYKRVGF